MTVNIKASANILLTALLTVTLSCTREIIETPEQGQGIGEYKSVTVSLALDTENEIAATPRTKSIDDPVEPAKPVIHNICILQYAGTEDSSPLIGEVHYLRDDVDPEDEDYLDLDAIRLAESEGQTHTLVILANTFTRIPKVETLGEMIALTRRIEKQQDLFGYNLVDDEFPGGATVYCQRLNALAVTTVTGATHIKATLRRSMSHVKVRVTNTGKDGLVITSIQLKNVPMKDYYISDYRYIDPSDGSEQSLRPDPFHDSYDSANPLRMDYPEESVEIGASGTQDFSYYMACNMRGTVENDLPSEKNRTAHSSGASYIVINGGYGDDHDQPITYTFYLGANLKNDFNLNPNTVYDYTFSFDGKGNVETDSRIQDFGGVDFDLDANSYMLKIPPTGASTYSFNVVHRTNIFWGDRYGMKSQYPNNPIAPTEAWKVRIIWSDFEMSQDEASVFLSKKNGTGGGSYMDASQRVKVKIPAGHPGGNVLLGVYTDDPTNILWSWHLWITNYEPDAIRGTSPVDGTYVYAVPGGEVHRYGEYTDAAKTKESLWHSGKRYEAAFIMDRNLGEMDNMYHPSASIRGKYYQFGRKDPFNGSMSVWTYDPDTFAPSTLTDGGVVKIIRSEIDNGPTFQTGGKNVPYAVNHPDTFIYGSSTLEYYWTGGTQATGGKGDIFNPVPYTSSIQWQDPKQTERVENEEGGKTDNKTFFDPCPPGWRLPVNGWVSMFSGDGSGSATGSTTVNFQWGVDATRGTGRTYFPLGYLADRDSPNPQTAFFPASGYRSNSSGAVCNVGSNGYFWSSSPLSVTNGYYLLFNSSSVTPSNYSNRCYGFPVRCVQE